MKKTRTEMAIKRIGTMMLAGVLLLGVVLSGVFASDMPAEEAAQDETADIMEADQTAAQSELEAFEADETEAQSGEEAAKADETETQSESEAANTAEEPVTASAKAEFSDNLISGVIWLDENEDGVMDAEEPGIGEFPVSLYQDGEVIDTTETAEDGRYLFENLEPGEYIVGVQSEIINETEYLLPLCGTDDDNRFVLTELEDDIMVALTEPIDVDEDTYEEDIHAGMQKPLGIRAAASKTYIVTGEMSGSIGEYDSLTDAVANCVANESCTITVTQNDTLNEVIEIPADKEIILTSDDNNSWTITQATELARSSTGMELNARHFIVRGSLTLDSITLKGKGYGYAADIYNGGVYITGSGAKCVMMEAAVIEYCANYYGGGVNIQSGCTFTMNGGTIRNNEAGIDGGGVYNGGGTFTMKDGEISLNKGTDGGGVANSEKAIFVMEKGTINANEALVQGGGLSVENDATFTIDNGTISNNSAGTAGGGMYIYENDLTLSAGTVVTNNSTDGEGGGVYFARCELELDGGEISGNSAVSGGGVYLASSGTKLTMISGKINANKATDGGGIYCWREAEMRGGEINGNEAEGNGGGIYIYNSGNSKFTMSSGEISANKAEGDGGGVWVGTSGTFTMSGGAASYNTGTNGGAIYTGTYSTANPVAATSYRNLSIDESVEMEKNEAEFRYGLPDNYTDITYVPGRLLNNNDIIYTGTYPVYFINYYANNGTTESTFQELASGSGGAALTLLTASEAGFTPPDGYVLASWNTQDDGKGDSYALGTTITIDDHLTLYAVWELAVYEITEQYRLVDDSKVEEDGKETVLAGADYQKTAPVLEGYRYLGYKLDGGTLQSGATVTILAVDTGHTVTYVYEEYSEMIHVSVPVKLLWAAYESDNGDVTSPEYYFYNRSSYDINVTLQKLTVTKLDGLDLVSTAGSGADEVDLQFNPNDQTGWQMISQVSLLSGSSGEGLLGKISAGSQGVFDITGTYGGGFSGFDLATEAYLQPKYEAVFRFELTH